VNRVDRVRARTPPQWTCIGCGGPAPFVSWARYRRPDGSVYEWRARPHRKHAGPHRAVRDPDPAAPRRWWAPHRLAWWLAVLFLAGSALFAVGAAGSLTPALFGGQWRMSLFAESCYFTGALLYTAATYGLLLEALNTDPDVVLNGSAAQRRRFRWFLTSPAELTRLEVVIPVVFLIGSVTFNYETTGALGHLLHLVPRLGLWQATMVGSVLFLLASALQFIEAAHGYLRLDLRNVSWWIGVAFVVGSVGFVAGSLPGLGTPGLPDADLDAGALIVKAGFLAGSLAYLAGSYLMLPELVTQLRSAPTPEAA